MKACVRPPEPELMTRHGARWARRFAEARGRNPSHAFQWPRHQGAPLNRHLEPPLDAMTARHCACGDGYPIDDTGYRTIDHFRPKSTHPQLAFEWTNLFRCCGRCNGEKGERFDERLLRPDEAGFTFERYFVFDYKTGDIVPNPAAPPEDAERAAATLRLLGLNEDGRPASRLRQIRLFRQRGADLDDFAYRFALLA